MNSHDAAITRAAAEPVVSAPRLAPLSTLSQSSWCVHIASRVSPRIFCASTRLYVFTCVGNAALADTLLSSGVPVS